MTPTLKRKWPEGVQITWYRKKNSAHEIYYGTYKQLFIKQKTAFETKMN